MNLVRDLEGEMQETPGFSQVVHYPFPQQQQHLLLVRLLPLSLRLSRLQHLLLLQPLLRLQQPTPTVQPFVLRIP